MILMILELRELRMSHKKVFFMGRNKNAIYCISFGKSHVLRIKLLNLLLTVEMELLTPY